MKVSIYKNIRDTTSQKTIDLDLLLENIKDGIYQDDVLAYRRLKPEQKEERRKAKDKLNNVTISGTFTSRKDAELINHTGFLCIDIDDIDDIDEIKSIICADKYVYAAFTSVSGYGIAALFRINANRHRDSFYAISGYLRDNYGIIVDPTAINVSRTRYVSYDPDLYINERAEKFTDLPKKETAKQHKSRTKQVIFVQNDFETIVNKVIERNIDLTENYKDWLNIGFGIADKLGESGRPFFHDLSAISQKYNSRICDKQYDNCLKANGTGITISTFYWLAKNAGIVTYSKDTLEVASKIKSSLKKGGNIEGVKNTLVNILGYDTRTVEEVAPQVDANLVLDDVSDFEEMANYVVMNYDFRKNDITGYYELKIDGVYEQIYDEHINYIYVDVNKKDMKAGHKDIKSIIMNKECPVYNPFKTFIAKNKDKNTTGNIRKLSDCIQSSYGLSDDERYTFIKKWVVGLIASIYNEPSSLMLVLTGEKQGIGKTEFFRRLLPDSLKGYYAETNSFSSKDDWILMVNNLIVMVDEMSALSEQQMRTLKDISTKRIFNIRAPYSPAAKAMPRLAVLCGTSNESALLGDLTGNRRIIPVHVNQIDHKAYNAICKESLFMEAYNLYQSGFSHNLSREQIDIINYNSDAVNEFKNASYEEQMMLKYFVVPEDESLGKFYTTTDIKNIIDNKGKVNTSLRKIGAVLKNVMKVKRQTFRNANGNTQKGYLLYLQYITEEGYRPTSEQNDYRF